jgi:hypothetical protein
MQSIRVGDQVQHSGTRQWGEVLEICPQPDGTQELRVRRIGREPLEGEGWWASYHVGQHRSLGRSPCP